MSNGAEASAVGAGVGLQKGHPKGLYVLFLTEMWERFCYYGMRSILVYYMTKQLLFAQDKASHIYGLYIGFSYATLFVGGWIADRFIGQRRAVFAGGIIMAAGEFVLMSGYYFYLGLLLMIIGNGFFKPNISTQVGSLYAQGDHRRDRAFNIFYMGINVGAFIAPLICGTLGELYGWKYGFGAAGIGVLIGLVIYYMGQKHLAPDRIMKRSSAVAHGEKVSSEKLTKEDWYKVLGLVVLCIFNIVFWGTYEQQGNTLALWADANTNRMIFGWEMPASWFQSFNPIMVIALIPLIDAFWAWQARRGKEPSSVAKMSIGCFLLGISFLILIPAAWVYDSGVKASLLWLTFNTFILTIGEIYLSPVGLSLVTKVSPPKIVSTMMGVWFLSSFFGGYVTGWIGAFWEKMPKQMFFLTCALIAAAGGVGFLVTLKPLKRAIGHGKEVDV